MRLIVASLVAALVIVLVAAPALAARDPFQPAIAPGSSLTSTTSTGTLPSTTTTVGTTTTAPRGLPNTGGDPAPWLALAYVLVVGGGAALVIARLYAPRARMGATR